jgi:hypothetical protein
MSEFKKVSTEELTRILLALPNGIGSLANVVQYTTPKCTKFIRNVKEWDIVKEKQVKIPFTDEIRKESNVSVLVATDYERNVVNQLNKENLPETDYKKGINTMPIILDESENTFAGTFKGKGVIQYRPISNPKKIVQPKFYLNKIEVKKIELPDVLPLPTKPTNQGTKKPILWRKLYIENIKQISIQGVKYENTECSI